jgi:hypothetical protein
MTNTIPEFILRSEITDFRDLPWELPFSQWPGNCQRLEEVPVGVSRHPVLFVNYAGKLFALKEMHPKQAATEYELLNRLEVLQLPAVTPVGFVKTATSQGSAGILITRYLDQSLPYRTLFMQTGLELYRQHLLDAIAGLLVQLHLAGVYWGDCSLSNTLFRRDAGALRAYLVDAETSEYCPQDIPPVLRFQELEIMEENVNGELLDLKSLDELAPGDLGVPGGNTGAYIRLCYQRLWEEITREEIITSDERYRIQERIRSLNELGFSVGDVALTPTDNGDQLRLRVVVTDRNFHQHQLYGLTGLDVEEMQARKLMNEIQEIKATLSRQNNRSTPLSVAAYHWLEKVYAPVVARLECLVNEHTSPAELYCQVLEHKWYLSESARQDVGHQAATADYLQRFSGCQ